MEQDEFVSVFRNYLHPVSLYLSRRVPVQEVEDLAAEIFEIAWRKKNSCPEGMELAWLYRIAGFVVANFRRKAIRRIVFLPILDHDFAAPSAEDVALNGSELSEAFNLLGAADRQILSLLGFEQLDISEIALALGTSTNTATKRISRARERLAINLAKAQSELN